MTLVPVPPRDKPGPSDEPKNDSCTLDLTDRGIGGGIGGSNGYDESHLGDGKDIGRQNIPKPGAGTGTPQTRPVTVQPTKERTPSTTSPATPTRFTFLVPNSIHIVESETSTVTRIACYPVTGEGSSTTIYLPGSHPKPAGTTQSGKHAGDKATKLVYKNSIHHECRLTEELSHSPTSAGQCNAVVAVTERKLNAMPLTLVELSLFEMAAGI